MEEVEKKDELAELNSKYLLLYSDFQNYKRRTEIEKEEIKKKTKLDMLSSILDMSDDISFALKTISDSKSNEGLNLILSKLDKFLKSNGVEEIQTDVYDSELHEVISVINGDGIVDVVSKGYTLNGVPFRYPKIILGNG